MVQVSDFFSLYKKYAWDKDIKGMIALYADDVVIFDMWNDARLEGLTKWSNVIEQWLGSLKDERVNVIFDNIKIHTGEAISFASAIVGYQAISADNKILRSMRNRITLGFIRVDNGWKVVHQHTSAPIDTNLQAILADK